MGSQMITQEPPKHQSMSTSSAQHGYGFGSAAYASGTT